MTTDPSTPTHRRTGWFWWAGLTLSLGTLTLLLTVGSSIHRLISTLGGGAIMVGWFGGFLLTAVAVGRALRYGRPKTPLPFSLGIVFAAAASVASTVLLVATISSLMLVGTPLEFSRAERNHAVAAAMRPWALPADSTIDPVDAGARVMRLAFARSARQLERLTPRPIDPLGEAPWPGVGGTPLAPEIFPNHRSGAILSIALIDSLPRTLTPAERDFLRRVAEAPQWTEVGIVARAPHVDLLAGQVMLPLSDEADIFDLPFTPALPLRALAQANAARIAYHLQRGDRAAARRAADELLSFGLRLIDGSRSLAQALVGYTIAGIAREQLIRTLRVLGDPEADRIAAAHAAAMEGTLEPRNGSVTIYLQEATRLRETVLTTARTARPSLLRWEVLRFVAVLPCTDTRTVVFGADAETREAIALMRSELAQTASDSALVTIAEETPERRGRRAPGPDLEIIERTARFGSAVFGSPRLAGCVTGFVGI